VGIEALVESSEREPLRVGRYEILEEVGRGGMGIVYRARQTDLNRMVALKALHGTYSGGEFVKSFARESRLASALSHPNIVTVYEYFEDTDTPYISMEYISGGSLRRWVGHLSLAQLAWVLEGLLAGLAAVEPTGIVHRDVKPENVLVTDEGRVKIADFGIAKATEGDGRLTTSAGGSTAMIGTPAYMAPEQASSGKVGPWTDLYSVGILAYEQLVGHVPFHESKTAIAMLFQHVNESVPAVAASRPGIDPALSAWVGRLVAKDPAARPRSAMQAWEEFEEIIIGLVGARWRRDARLEHRASEREPVLATTRRGFESQVIELPLTVGATGGHQAMTSGPMSTAPAPIPPLPTVRPATPATPARSPRRMLTTGVLLLGLAAGLPVGLVVAPRRTRVDKGVPLSGSASTRALEVSLPADWTRAARQSGPTFGMKEPLQLNAPQPSAHILIGIAPSSSPTLLPSQLLVALGQTPQPSTITLKGASFYRYLDLQPRGTTANQSVYARPTTDGVLLGLCTLPRREAHLLNTECERILASVVVPAASSLALGPSRAYASALNKAVSGFDHTQASSGLPRARTSAAQATDAEHLANTARDAAAQLRSAQHGPAEDAVASSIVAGFDRVAEGYNAMAAGARAEDSRGFDHGRQVVHSGSRAVAAALRALKPFGYSPTR
jgi:serine/threonine protein kinase